uniref:Uncharacterized protein n=1 Tax=Meloidogyne hapla TaxID=6305 RepID=A0A1I8BAX4_MELHA
MLYSTKIILIVNLLGVILPIFINAINEDQLDESKQNFSMPNCTDKHDEMDQSSPRPIGLPPCKPPFEHNPRRVGFNGIGEGHGPNKS